MAKCPICNRTFEPTTEEIRNARPWSVNICSRQCWCHSHKDQNPDEHRYEYHVGDVGEIPSIGKKTGNFKTLGISTSHMPMRSIGVHKWR